MSINKTAEQDLLDELGLGSYDDAAVAAMAEEIALDDFAKIMKWTEGRNVIRVIPAVKGADGIARHFRKTYVHFFDRPSDGQTIPFACAMKGAGTPCIGCEWAAKMRASSDPVKVEAGKKLGFRPVYYVNVIRRGEETKGPQVASCSRTLMLALNKQIKAMREEVKVDPLNPFFGRDIAVEKTGTGRDTDWTVTIGQLDKPIVAEWKGAAPEVLRDGLRKLLDGCHDLERVAAPKGREEIISIFTGTAGAAVGGGGSRAELPQSGARTIDVAVVGAGDGYGYDDDFDESGEPAADNDNIPF